MRAAGVESVVVAGSGRHSLLAMNCLCWLTGFRQLGRDAAVLLTGDQDPILFVEPGWEAARAQRESGASKFAEWIRWPTPCGRCRPASRRAVRWARRGWVARAPRCASTRGHTAGRTRARRRTGRHRRGRRRTRHGICPAGCRDRGGRLATDPGDRPRRVARIRRGRRSGYRHEGARSSGQLPVPDRPRNTTGRCTRRPTACWPLATSCSPRSHHV